MKTDTYTKGVLTVIAVCLTFNLLKDINVIPKAHAGDPVYNAAQSMKYGLVPINADGSINVNVKSASTLDVDIVDISTSDELDINIDEVGGFSTFGTVPVKVKQ
jgi:hypothetical protein